MRYHVAALSLALALLGTSPVASDLNGVGSTARVAQLESGARCTLTLAGTFDATIAVQVTDSASFASPTTLGTMTAPGTYTVVPPLGQPMVGVQAITTAYTSGDPIASWDCTGGTPLSSGGSGAGGVASLTNSDGNIVYSASTGAVTSALAQSVVVTADASGDAVFEASSPSGTPSGGNFAFAASDGLKGTAGMTFPAQENAGDGGAIVSAAPSKPFGICAPGGLCAYPWHPASAPSCSVSAATSCSAAVTLPSTLETTCTAAVQGMSLIGGVGQYAPEVSISGTTLTITAFFAASATGTDTFSVLCF